MAHCLVSLKSLRNWRLCLECFWQSRDGLTRNTIFFFWQEEILVHEDGKVETIEQHQEFSVVGEVGVLCSIPQPFTVRVSELCRLLRINKHDFSDLVQIYFNDGRLLINNLLEVLEILLLIVPPKGREIVIMAIQFTEHEERSFRSLQSRIIWWSYSAFTFWVSGPDCVSRNFILYSLITF